MWQTVFSKWSLFYFPPPHALLQSSLAHLTKRRQSNFILSCEAGLRNIHNQQHTVVWQGPPPRFRSEKAKQLLTNSGMLGLQTPTHGTQGPMEGLMEVQATGKLYVSCSVNTTSWAQLSSHHSPGTKHVEWRTLPRIPVLCHSCLPQHLCLLSWDSTHCMLLLTLNSWHTERLWSIIKWLLSHITKSWTVYHTAIWVTGPPKKGLRRWEETGGLK